MVGQFEARIPSGAKARAILGLLSYGLKPVPFKLTHYRIFQQVPKNLSENRARGRPVGVRGLPPIRKKARMNGARNVGGELAAGKFEYLDRF